MSPQLSARGAALTLFNGQQGRGDSLDNHSSDVANTHNANTPEGSNQAVEHYAAKRGEVHRRRWPEKMI